MPDSLTFALRPFPHRLVRTLLGFAGAGTVMALVVWSDGNGPRWLPLGMVIACWLIPALFAWQVKRQGFDPLVRLVATEKGLEAYDREGRCRFVAWDAVERLIEVEGFRHRSWAIVAGPETLRWFGELEEPEAFAGLAAERTGLSWEKQSQSPLG